MEVSGKLLDTGDVGNTKVCELCEYDNVKTQSDGFCKECQEFMCDGCFQQHIKVKLCRNHEMISVSNLSALPISDINDDDDGDDDDDDDTLKCMKHRGQIVRFYCRRHEYVGCGDCMLFEHKACDPEYIKDVSKHFKRSETYRSLISKVENLSSAIKTNEDQVESNKKENKKMLATAVAGVEKFRQDMNTYLDIVEANIIFEAKQILASNDKLLATMEETCRHVNSELKKIQAKIDANAYTDTVLFVNATEGKSNLSDIAQSLAQLNPKNIKKFEFVADEQLRNAVSSMRKPGTLTASSTEKQAIQSDSGNQAGVRGASGTSIPPQQSQEQTQNVGPIKETRKTSGRQTDADVASGSSVPTKQSREQTQSVASSKDVKPTVVVGARVRSNYGLTPFGGLIYDEDGTVTAVKRDGRVAVKWDNKWAASGTYTVGTGLGDVTIL